MKSKLANTKLITLFLAALLLTFFFSSMDQYKVSASNIHSLLAESKTASLSLADAVLKVHAKLNNNYDRIVEKNYWLNQTVVELKSQLNASKEVGFFSGGALSSWFFPNFGKAFSVDKLSSLVEKRSELIDQYKTQFSAISNSEKIVFQLLGNLMEKYPNTTSSGVTLLELEKNIIYLVERHPDKYREEVFQQLDNFSMESESRGDRESKSIVLFIERHIDNILDKSQVVDALLKRGVDLQDAIFLELTSIEKEVEFLRSKEQKRAELFSTLFLIASVIILILWGFQSRKTRLLAQQLTYHNENLGATVKKRTAHLEAVSERLQEEKNERETLLVELDNSREKLDSIINSIHGCIFEFSYSQNKILHVSRGAEAIWGVKPDEVKTLQDIACKVHADDYEVYQSELNDCVESRSVLNTQYRVVKANQEVIWVRDICTPRVDDDGGVSIVSLLVDVTEFKQLSHEKKRMEEELVHAQKLESVGQLAAGIAHEINTPAQFVSDNLLFLKESFDEILGLLGDIREKVKASSAESIKGEVDELCEKADLTYLASETVPALEQSSQGIASIAEIVRAMKEYSHPGETFDMADINKAIESTITISRTEWKYVSVLETDLAEDLPMVECVIGNINQTVLNMIVNAAHAIVSSEKFDNPDDLEGRILIKTRVANEFVAIEVSDNGSGMPESVKTKIFDQFYTTKGVGKGTGQGLSIAYRFIVEKHKGRIEVDSDEGVGTTFRILLPIKQVESSENLR